MQTIALSGIRLFAYVGCTEEEQILGNEIEVDIKVSLEEKDANDDLRLTVDYQKLFAHVRAAMVEPKHLLETVCENIMERISAEFPYLTDIEVKVAKLNPPLNGTAKHASVLSKKVKSS